VVVSAGGAKKVGELIRRLPITAYPSDTLIDVIEKMTSTKWGLWWL